VYQVPVDVLPRPSGSMNSNDAALVFNFTEDPFSFSVTRKSNGEALFDTSNTTLVFQSQYVRLRTKLPASANIYGLGEHADSFHLPTQGYSRTLWNRENPNLWPPENVYGSHPVYFEHRGSAGTHGVFLLNSNGMDVNITSDSNGPFLQYNTVGGIVDLYILAGPNPEDVSKQYAEVVGLPAMIPYWTLGFHQCKYGYRDIYEVAEVIANYSQAGIPLETMWDDIDYMDRRRDFTTDPDRYPLSKFRELVEYLHSHQQHSILMVDPGIAYGDTTYGPYARGVSKDVFLKRSNGSIYANVQWAGPATFVDWFHENAQDYWTQEIQSFFNPDTGIDVDGAWIDMNEASLFCPYPCADPAGYAQANDDPPTPPPARNNSGRLIPGFPPDFQPGNTQSIRRRDGGLGLPGRNYIDPPYAINDRPHDPPMHITNFSIDLDLQHANKMMEYDTHNLFGRMMAAKTRQAMISRRQGKRPFVLTRSTFASSGKDVGHWTGEKATHHYLSVKL
jgi:alpha-glucosidase